ncbi:WD40 repeat domain-containing protein [Paenibacillus sp. TAB 01]|uniref:WD40 repeat domain-containing protein n=1 Tax=Paenibacillus sp. TAB 01 TaxID=3368988 RepID=UPI0037506CFD
MSHNRIKPLLVVSFLLLAFTLSGCGTGLTPRTVVIPDTEADSGPALQGDFQIEKIYKLTDNDLGYARIWGWIDQDELLGEAPRPDRSNEIERIDYRNNAHTTIKGWNEAAEVIGFSPDGRFAASSDYTGGVERIRLFQLTDGQELPLGGSASGRMRITPLAWSSSGRYLAYGEGTRASSAGNTLTVYDTQSLSSRSYALPAGKVSSIRISNEGSGVLLAAQTASQFILSYGRLEGDSWNSLFEHSLKIDGSFDFINEDQILLTGQNGALLGFDRRNATTTVLAEQAGAFRLSPDRSYIAFTK